MRIASFNLFFFPSHAPHRVARSSDDLALVARILERLDADVLVFQEILELDALADVLDTAGKALGRRYSLRDGTGKWLASAGNDAILKVAMSFDDSRLSLEARHKLPSPASRSVVLELADRVTREDARATLTVIGVHLRSSGAATDTDLELPNPGRAKRLREAQAIAAWVEGFDADGAWFGLSTADAVLLGDFNATAHADSVSPLREGALASWTWHELSAPGTVGPSGETEPWTSYLDRSVIDHVLTSPGLTRRITTDPRIYAFDHDPKVGDPTFMHEDGPRIAPGISIPPRLVPNLYRVSDHRPIVIDLDWP